MVTQKEIKKEYGKKSITKLTNEKYDGIIIAVAHECFKKLDIKNIIKLCKNNKVIFDLKSIFDKKHTDLTL